MQKTVVIGSGNVAEALALALTGAGNPPVQIFARNEAEGRKLAQACGSAFTSKAEDLARADLYLIAVSDSAITDVASSLDFGGGVVAHTAGSVELGALPAKIADRAVMYPFQTFTKGRRVDFGRLPVFVEGNTPRALGAVAEVARSISGDVRELDSAGRTKLHLAAVFACNFANYMYTVGEELAGEAGEDFEILKPLILETAQKAAGAGSPRATQTGPAVRGDYRTKSLHCDMLATRPDLQNIYINLSNKIWETSKKI